MAGPILTLPKGQVVPLEKHQLLIGRIPHDPVKHRTALDLLQETARCDGDWLYLPDPFVSRQHAKLTRCDDHRYAIEDLGSRCGTFVNSKLITQKKELNVGDRITVGQSTIIYLNEIGHPPETPWEYYYSD